MREELLKRFENVSVIDLFNSFEFIAYSGEDGIDTIMLTNSKDMMKILDN